MINDKLFAKAFANFQRFRFKTNYFEINEFYGLCCAYYILHALFKILLKISCVIIYFYFSKIFKTITFYLINAYNAS